MCNAEVSARSTRSITRRRVYSRTTPNPSSFLQSFRSQTTPAKRLLTRFRRRTTQRRWNSPGRPARVAPPVNSLSCTIKTCILSNAHFGIVPFIPFPCTFIVCKLNGSLSQSAPKSTSSVPVTPLAQISKCSRRLHSYSPLKPPTRSPTSPL